MSEYTGRGDLVDQFLEDEHLSQNASPYTIRSYYGALRDFWNHIGGRVHAKYEHVDRRTIVSFMGRLHNRKLSQNTIAHRVSVVKAFYKFLVREDIIKHNPAELIKIPPVPKRLPKPIPQDDLAAMLDSTAWRFQCNAPGLRDRAIMELLYATGVRVGELVGINIDDLRLKEDDGVAMLLIRLGKGKKERMVPVGRKAVAALQAYLPMRDSVVTCDLDADPDPEALFINWRGARLTDRSVRRIVVRCLVQHVPAARKKTPHALRASFATHMLGGGADERSIQELLGHSSISTTMKYLDSTPDRLRKVHEGAHPLDNREDDSCARQSSKG